MEHAPSRAGAEFSTHCAVLGLRTVRNVEALNAAYRPLILRWHPDRHHGQPSHAMAVERAAAINAAYAFLLAVFECEQERGVPAASTPAAPAAPPRGDGFPDKSVLEIFVKPSRIISVGYNSSTSDLYVKYIGHRIYRYRSVPHAVVEALLQAPSASAFVSAHIDRHYEAEALKRSN